jgi:hypothetical protein
LAKQSKPAPQPSQRNRKRIRKGHETSDLIGGCAAKDARTCLRSRIASIIHRTLICTSGGCRCAAGGQLAVDDDGTDRWNNHVRDRRGVETQAQSEESPGEAPRFALTRNLGIGSKDRACKIPRTAAPETPSAMPPQN